MDLLILLVVRTNDTQPQSVRLDNRGPTAQKGVGYDTAIRVSANTTSQEVRHR